MGLLLVRLVELLIVLVPVIGVGVAGYKAYSAARGRQGYDEETRAPARATNPAAQWRAISRTVSEHDRTDTRWLDYEIDVGKLLDYPLMTDMRNPLTERFH